MLKKLKGRKDPSGFYNIRSVAKLQKNKGGPFGGKIFEKQVPKCRKKLKGGTL